MCVTKANESHSDWGHSWVKQHCSRNAARSISVSTGPQVQGNQKRANTHMTPNQGPYQGRDLSEKCLKYYHTQCPGKFWLMLNGILVSEIFSWEELKPYKPLYKTIFLDIPFLETNEHHNHRQGSHEILETKFHDFSMTELVIFHDYLHGRDSRIFWREID